MTERFLPRGVVIGNIYKAIEVAHSQLPISARVYTDLEAQLRHNFDKEKHEKAAKVLRRVIRQPKVLRSMSAFFEMRDQIVKRELRLNGDRF